MPLLARSISPYPLPLPPVKRGRGNAVHQENNEYPKASLCRLILASVVILLVAACDTSSLATETPTDVPLTIIAPSATVAPIPPTVPTSEAGNVADGNKFTPGALPGSAGNSNATITPTPAPTQAALPIAMIGADGLAIAG